MTSATECLTAYLERRKEVTPRTDAHGVAALIIDVVASFAPSVVLLEGGSAVSAATHAVALPHWPDGERFLAVGDDDASWIALAALMDADLAASQLRAQSRVSLRTSQRVATQLHQIITATLNATSASTPSGIASAVVRRARSVFGADEAWVLLTTPLPLAMHIVRGQLPRRLDPTTDSPLRYLSQLTKGEPTRLDDYLVAPLDDGEDSVFGLLAIRRSAPFTSDDIELAALLARVTSATIRALVLRTALGENEARVRTLVNTAPVAIVETSSSGDVRWWNEAARSLLTKGETPQWPIALSDALEPHWRRAARGEHLTAELDPVVIGDHQRIYSISMAPLPSGNAIVTVLVDVTTQRALTEEMRHAHRMELRGQVASSVAHDFNNLITLVQGYGDLLRPHVSDEEGAALLHALSATAQRAAALTAQLQSVGRTNVAAMADVDVHEVLGGLAEVLDRILGASVTVNLTFGADDAVARTDADRLEQLVLNIATNARDAMNQGGAFTITTELTRDVPDELTAGDYLLITFTDTGTGMDAETLAHCFDPLFTTKGALRGTGMGLASASRLAHDSGGTITARSVLGEGTSFQLYLPHVATPSIPRGEQPVRTDARVAVIDDDLAMWQLMVQILRRQGFTIIDVQTPESLLADPERFSLDLLVTDVDMPSMSGDELARTIRQELPDIGLLVVSGSSDDSSIAGLANAVFLAKPFRPTAFVDAVLGLLSR